MRNWIDMRRGSWNVSSHRLKEGGHGMLKVGIQSGRSWRSWWNLQFFKFWCVHVWGHIVIIVIGHQRGSRNGCRSRDEDIDFVGRSQSSNGGLGIE